MPSRTASAIRTPSDLLRPCNILRSLSAQDLLQFHRMTIATSVTSTAARRQNGHVSQLIASDLDEVSEFLRRSFDAHDDAPIASRDMLRWKYIEPADIGLEDASYILGSNGRIVAHAGLRIATFRSPDGGRHKCGVIVDWTADRSAPGAGIALYRHLMGQVPATYLIGGTATTQAVAERLGFKRGQRARVYARWVRPLDEFLKRPMSPRSALRLLHGVAHASLDRLASVEDLSILPVTAFHDSFGDVLGGVVPTHAIADRSVAALNHRLRNPMSPTRGYVIVRGDKAIGCALTTLGTWNARILALHGRFPAPKDLAAAYALVTAELARDPRVCRVSVLSSAASLQEALIANGFWLNRVEPVSFYDPTGRLSSAGELDIQYFDADIDEYNS
jgi:hypothetical protein